MISDERLSEIKVGDLVPVKYVDSVGNAVYGIVTHVGQLYKPYVRIYGDRIPTQEFKDYVNKKHWMRFTLHLTTNKGD